MPKIFDPKIAPGGVVFFKTGNRAGGKNRDEYFQLLNASLQLLEVLKAARKVKEEYDSWDGDETNSYLSEDSALYELFEKIDQLDEMHGTEVEG